MQSPFNDGTRPDAGPPEPLLPKAFLCAVCGRPVAALRRLFRPLSQCVPVADVDLKRRAANIVRQLAKLYPDATCSLGHRGPLELLIATILSAQCTDARVNKVTPALFAKYRSADDFARCPTAELEQAIQSTGFFRNKAKSIQGCCRMLVEEHGGAVPATLDALVKLPGVGRKTANVVLGTAMGVAAGVVVDTHVQRLTRRLGLTAEKDAERIERDLMALLPQREWIAFSHRLIEHGRQICVARKPKCPRCRLLPLCPQVDVTQVDET